MSSIHPTYLSWAQKIGAFNAGPIRTSLPFLVLMFCGYCPTCTPVTSAFGDETGGSVTTYKNHKAACMLHPSGDWKR